MVKTLYLTESINPSEKSQATRLFTFTRNKDGTKVMNEIVGFKPYFFVEENESIPSPNIIKITKGFKGYDKETNSMVSLKKIELLRSDLVTETRQLFKKTWEADVLFADRYMIDYKFPIDRVDLRIMFFDIEVNVDHTFPDIELADKEIISLVCFDSFSKKYTTFVWRQDLKNTIKETEDGSVRYFNSEVLMMMSFIKYFNSLSPDIVTGWNIDDFDLPYIFNRLDALKINKQDLSPIKYVSLRKGMLKGREAFMPQIKGVINLDLLKAFKDRKIMPSELTSFTLNNVAKEILKESKLEYDGTIHNLWQSDIETLIKYNKQDVYLTHKLDEKKKVIDLFDEIRRSARCQFNKVFQNSMIADAYLLHKFSDIRFPTRTKVEGEKYKGAFVRSPISGIHHMVATFDLEGMYPSIIRSFNVSFETLDPNGDIKLVNNYNFKSEPKGMVVSVIEELVNNRNVYKRIVKQTIGEEKEVANIRSNALKVLGNSFYGYLGFKGSRLYNRDVAEAITLMGQELINFTNDKITKLGYKVIYNDTDSAFVEFGRNISPERAIELGEFLSNYINESYNEFVKKYGSNTNHLRIAFEKLMSSILFKEAKKRYAYLLIWDGKLVEEELKVKGFGSVRSDTPKIGKTIQEDVFKMVLKEQFNELKTYLEIQELKIRNRQYSDSLIGFPQGINRPLEKYKQITPLIKAVIYSNKYLNTHFEQGTKPLYIFIKNVPLDKPQYIEINNKNYKLESIAYEDNIPDGFDIDFDRVIERILKMPLEDVLKAVGLDYSIIMNKNKILF